MSIHSIYDNLLDHSSFPLIDKKKKEIKHHIPNEILTHILSFTDPETLKNFANISDICEQHVIKYKDYFYQGWFLHKTLNYIF